jgi:hypothetical protein
LGQLGVRCATPLLLGGGGAAGVLACSAVFWHLELHVRRQKNLQESTQTNHLAALILQAAISKSRSSTYRPVKNYFLLRATPYPALVVFSVQLFAVVYFTTTETARTEGSHVALNRRVGGVGGPVWRAIF